MLTQYDYHCPKCNQKLSTERTVVFDIKRANGDKAKLELSPKPGEYSFRCSPELNFSEGEEIDFFCPACRKNLTSSRYEKFVEISLQVTEIIKFEVLFSRVYGDKRTYVITEETIEKHGDNPPDLD